MKKERWENTALMKACGSPTGHYNPESDEQVLYVLAHGKGEEKALAWVKTKTIFMSRSPYCVNENGKALYLDSMAAENGWSLRTAETYAYKLQAQGRIRLKGKRIWYRADVPENDSSDGRTEGEGIDIVQCHFPPYVVDFIKNLPIEKREVAKARYSEYWKWHLAGLRDSVKSWRAISEPIEDTVLSAIGYVKERIEKSSRPPRAVALQVLVPPDFVQTVQTASDGLYKHAGGSVQTDVSLLPSDPNPNPQIVSSSSIGFASSSDYGSAPETESVLSVASAPSPTAPEPNNSQAANAPTEPLAAIRRAPAAINPVPIAAEMKSDLNAARKVIAASQALVPDITEDELKQLAHAERARLGNRPNNTNLVGLLMTSIPQAAAGPRLDEIRAAAIARRAAQLAADRTAEDSQRRAARSEQRKEEWEQVSDEERAPYRRAARAMIQQQVDRRERVMSRAQWEETVEETAMGLYCREESDATAATA